MKRAMNSPDEQQQQQQGRGGGRGGRGRRQRQRRGGGGGGDNADVRISKALSWALRHAAPELGLTMGPDGYVPVQEILQHPHKKFRGATMEDIRRVVETNAKQRFSLTERNGEMLIRANQGHSITTIDPYLLLTPIPPKDLATMTTILHGTYMEPWEQHIRKEGLSLMSRTHIHFAAGMPGENQVISGMRKSCGVYVYIDAEQCARDKIEFFSSANGVLLTAGVNNEGILPPKYFSKVVTKDGKVLLQQANSA